MDFLKSGIKTVLGATEPGQQISAAETVEKLVDRVTSSTLLDDRRDACRALKALSRKYRIEVGAQGMTALLQVLQNDRQDAEIVSYALDTLCNIISNDEFEEEVDNPTVSVNVGEQFTEMFIKTAEHVTIVMTYLEEYDFRVRRGAIQLITSLITNKTRDLQEIILISPMGVSKLMDLLSDSREVIRNDALLLLIQLTKGNSNIQKIVAFENAFDKIFEIIRDEGCSDGGIIVEDCLILLLNLLKNNSSNQQFFKEGSYIQRLAPMFALAPETEELGWTPQKVSNFHCMLQVVRSLVTPSNQQQVISACQKAMNASKLLEALCKILMSSGVPADILTETINTVAEVVRGDKENQNEFSEVMAPSQPPRPVIVVLLMSMINEKQLLALRSAVIYSFQCYLFKNEAGQKAVVQTLLPSSAADVSSVTTGQLLCTGLFSNDTLANWFSSVALLHTLVDNQTQKEELLRVLLATQGGHKAITLLEQCTNLLQQEHHNKLQSKIGLLMLLSVWLSHCPNAVKIFLGTHDDTMAYLTAQVSAHEHDENEYLVQGLCAFLMGLCIQFNDNTLIGQKREDICQLIIKRIGQETFSNKLGEVSRHEAYIRACKQPQIRAKSAKELMLDYEYCKLYKGLEALVAKMVAGYDVNGIELTELTLSSEASALVAQYKGIIRDLDSEIRALKTSVSELENKNNELEKKSAQIQTNNAQLLDQNTLLKAQLVAVKSDSAVGAAVSANSNSKEHSSLHHDNDSDIATNSAQFQISLYQVENLRLLKELEILRSKLSAESQRANASAAELQKLQQDQEGFVMLLADQEDKLVHYRDQMRAAGLTIHDDDEDEDDDVDDNEDSKEASFITNQQVNETTEVTSTGVTIEPASALIS